MEESNVGSRRSGRIVGVLGPLLLVVLATAQLAPGFVDGRPTPPISWDHGAHLGKAMLTARELLPSLRGWSDSIEAGVPLNTLYSVGGTAFLLLVRAVTPFVDWVGSYAIAIIAVRALVALAVLRLVRAAGGSRTAGFAAGVFALVDHGDHSEGGWFYDIQFGVWPVSLGIALFLFGVADVVEARREGRAGLLPRAALLLGAALVSHQMVLLGLLVFGGSYVVTRAFDRSSSPESTFRDDLRTIAWTSAIALALSAFWLVPMLARRDEMAEHGQLYRSVAELGRGALTGEFVLRAGAFTAVACAFGVLRGLFANGTRRYFAVLAVLLLLISSRDWLVETGALRVVPTLGAIMYPRFMMLAKPFYFALAGWMVADLVASAFGDTRQLVGDKRGVVSLAIVGLLLVPFARGLGDGFLETAVRREVAYAGTDPLFHDFLEYARWERARAREDGYYRVAYNNTQSHLFQGAPAFTGRPAHKIGPLIAEVFGNTTPSGSLEALAAMNVRRVVSVGAPPATILGRSRHVATFGRIRVDDLEGFDPRVSYDPTGHARPRVAKLSRDSLLIEAAGARRIVVRRAFSRAFEAFADGRRIAVHPEPVPNAFPLRIMRLDVPAGTRHVRVHYDDRRSDDVVGAIVSALALLLVLFVSLPLRKTRALHERATSAWESVRTTRRFVLARNAAIVAAVALVVVFGLRAVASKRFDAADLDRVEVAAIDAAGAVVRCDAPRRDGGEGYQCPMADWTYVGPRVQTVEGRLRNCIWAHPLGSPNRLSISYPASTLGRSLRVGAGIGDEAMGGGGADVELHVRVDDAELGMLAIPWESQWIERTFSVRPGTHRVTFEVVASDPARRFLCFEASSRAGP